MVANLPRMGRPKKPEPSAPLRVPLSLLKRIRKAALHRGIDPGDYVALQIRAGLEIDEAEMFEAMKREQAARKGKK
jgi:hypothetical protein